MPDNKLELIVSIAGQSELNTLFAKIKAGTASIDEQAKAVKLATKLYNSWGSENDALKASLAGSIRTIKDLKTQAVDPLIAANGKMMKSYFRTGEELRRFYREQLVGDRTMREATQTLSGFGSMLGGEGLGKIVGTATGRFQEMEFAVNGLGIAAQSGSPKLASLGQKLIGFATPLAVAAAGFGLLMMAVKKADEVFEKFEATLKKQTELLISSGRISKLEQVLMLTRQLNTNMKEVKPDFWMSFLGPRTMGADFMTRLIEQQNKEIQILEKRKTLVMDIGKAEAFLMKMRVQEAEAWEEFGLPTKEYKAREAEEFLKGIRARTRAFDESRAMSPFQREVFKGGLIGQGKITGIKGVGFQSAGRLVQEGVGFGDMLKMEFDEEANKKRDAFISELTTGFRSAISVLADGFINTFHLGEGLAGRFAATLLSSFSAIAVDLGAKWIAVQLIGQSVQQASAAAMAATTAATMAGIAASATPAATLVSIATMGGAAAVGSAAVIAALGATQAAQTGLSFINLGANVASETLQKHAKGDYWFTEPTYAVGMYSGQKHMIAENGPEHLSNMNQVAQAGRYGGRDFPPMSLRTEIAGSNLALIVDVGTKQNDRRWI